MCTYYVGLGLCVKLSQVNNKKFKVLAEKDKKNGEKLMQGKWQEEKRHIWRKGAQQTAGMHAGKGQLYILPFWETLSLDL